MEMRKINREKGGMCGTGCCMAVSKGGVLRGTYRERLTVNHSSIRAEEP